MGCIYGFIFGALKIEDSNSKLSFDYAFMKDEYFCIPFGTLIGGISGALNEYFRQKVIL